MAAVAKIMHHFTLLVVAIPSKLPAKIGEATLSTWCGTRRQISLQFALMDVANPLAFCLSVFLQTPSRPCRDSGEPLGMPLADIKPCLRTQIAKCADAIERAGIAIQN